MANTVTYANALATIRDYAVENGFDNKEVIEKINNLIKQKTKTKANTGKSKARKDNEETVKAVVNLMRETGVTEIDNKWLRENVEGVNSPARATAVFNAGVDMGTFVRNVHTKSATRNTLTYTLAQSMEFGESPQNPHTLFY